MVYLHTGFTDDANTRCKWFTPTQRLINQRDVDRYASYGNDALL
jgi:hypothetical protein